MILQPINSELLKTIIALTSINPVTTIIFKPEEIEFKIKNPSNTVMLELIMSKANFVSYEPHPKEEKLNIASNLFSEVLSKATSKSILTIIHSEKEPYFLDVNIKGRIEKEMRLKLIEDDSSNEFKFPKLGNHTVTITCTVDDFKDMLDSSAIRGNIKNVSTTFIIETTKNHTRIKTTAKTLGDFSTTIYNSDESKIEIKEGKEKYLSRYNRDLISDLFFSLCKKYNTEQKIKIEYGEDYPIRLSVKSPLGSAKMILAPIELEESTY